MECSSSISIQTKVDCRYCFENSPLEYTINVVAMSVTRMADHKNSNRDLQKGRIIPLRDIPQWLD